MCSALLFWEISTKEVDIITISDEEMLKQDLAHGFMRVPNPIMETLMVTKINATQLKICMFISRRTYGWNKSEGPITLTEFAAACNTSKAYISKQIIELMNMNIIRRIRRQGRLYYHMESDLTLWRTVAGELDKLSENKKAGIYKYSKYSLKTHRRNRHPVHNEHKITPIESAAKETEGYAPQLLPNDQSDSQYDYYPSEYRSGTHSAPCEGANELNDCTTLGVPLSAANAESEPCPKTIKDNKDSKNSKDNEPQIKQLSVTAIPEKEPEGSYDDMTFNQEVMSENDGLRSYHDMTPELYDCTTRQHDQTSHLLDYEPCLKTNLKTDKDIKTVRRRSYLRHDCSDRKGSYVDMKVQSYVDMTPGLHNHTTVSPEQGSITAEFEPLLNTDLKKVKENVLYVQHQNSENAIANLYEDEQVHVNNKDLPDRDRLLNNQEKINSVLKLSKDGQEDPLYGVYLMWRDSIFGQKDIEYNDWLAMKKERSRDGP